MKRNYIVNLNYGMWRNQLWFIGDEGSEAEFERAEKTLGEACGNSGNSSEFFEKVTQHFESFGFVSICK